MELLSRSIFISLLCVFAGRAIGQMQGGDLLVVAGKEYRVPEMKARIDATVARLSRSDKSGRPGYFVRIVDDERGMEDVLKTVREWRERHGRHRLGRRHIGIAGVYSGAAVLARVIQKLDAGEQPDDLLFLSPIGLGETLPGTVLPAIMPPLEPRRLLVICSPGDEPGQVNAASEYAKTWKGYDGLASFYLTAGEGARMDAGWNKKILDSFLLADLRGKDRLENPAAIPIAGYSPKRHEEKLTLTASKKYDLILIGNSITNNFEKPAYQPVWDQFFAPRNALNLGYSGYRTENLLWNIEHGELDGQSPKVVVLEIGTNNIDEKNYPTRHTAGQLAGGIGAIVHLLRQKLPNAKIIVLRCFPGCYGGPNPSSHRAILERASDEVSHLADGEHIFYCDVNHVFLNLDGSIDHNMMSDWLHPSPAGAKAWAQAMEPLLSRLMADRSLDTELPSNTAVIPTPKLEDDFYNWWDRHAEVLRIKDSVNPEIVLIGNSITHMWGGLPQSINNDGRPRPSNGPLSWSSLFAGKRVLNLGFGWDRTQNVLWRLDHGEIDGLHPRLVIIDIGTNNTSQTEHARMNTAPEIAEGIRAICARVRSKIPGARIVLMAIFPREQLADHPRRVLINDVNRLLETFARDAKIDFVNIGAGFLAADGSMLPGMTYDLTHPTEKGYQVWADAIRTYVMEP